MKKDDMVRVVRCEICPAAVNKTAKIKGFVGDDSTMVSLNFGKGRPPLGRPEFFPIIDLTNVSDPIAEVNV